MRVWILLCIILCITVAPASADYLITEICPDGYAKGDGDEYFVLSGTGSLDGWTITDGEGSVRFPPGTTASGGIIIAREGTAYHSIHGTYPDYEIYSTHPSVPDALFTGRFQMANTKDDITLLYHDSPVQSFSWPEDFTPGNGRIHLYTDGIWDERIYKIGQSRFSPETFTAESVTLFVSPDSSFEVVDSVITNARSRLCISMYEFTHPELAESVADAASRGVAVTLLVEGGPVGGMSSEEKGVLNYLTDAGAAIYTIESTDKLPARYRYLHAKYLIADEETTLILSENFKPTGIPLPGTRGNRGWGAAVHSAGVADYFHEVFTADLTGYDIYPYVPGTEPLPDTWKDKDITVRFPPHTVYNVAVTPIVSPDTSALIPRLIQNAREKIDLQQAYISGYPGGAHNIWLDLVLETGGRGIPIRVMLDGMYYNTESDADNDEIVANINRIAKKDNIYAAAELKFPDEYITKLHNKGLIVDMKYVLISSVNWNYNSPNNNREAGIILKNEESAEYFSEIFQYDWNGDPGKLEIGDAKQIDLRHILVAVILVLLVVIWQLKRRR
ncbi:MAG: phospholipase D-like domain-containing protein [Methanocorpusculum sp.]|nr:phospholipase D-like domain-containing protein [Methanocorpusculum sp.]